MEKVAIVVCAIDGMESMETGVGVVVNSFIEHFSEAVEAEVSGTQVSVSLHCFFPKMLEGATGLREDLLAITKQKCAETGGDIVCLPTLSDAREWTSMWFGTSMNSVLQQWSFLSREAAKKLDELCERYDRVVAVLHDTPFAATMKYLKSPERLSCVWVPHSLGSIFDIDTDRYEFERHAIQIHTSLHGRVGYVSGFFQTVLREQYGVSQVDMLAFEHVLDLNSSRYQKKFGSRSDFIDLLPTASPLIFSWGRCKPQKGFDLILEAAATFLTDPDFDEYHLALLMPDATAEPDYLNRVKALAEVLPKDRVTIGWEFDPDAPYAVLSSRNLRYVILASRFEAFGIVACEAKVFCANKVRILFSPIEPFIRTFDGTENSVVLRNLSAGAILDALRAGSESATARTHDTEDYLTRQREIIGALLCPGTVTTRSI